MILRSITSHACRHHKSGIRWRMQRTISGSQASRISSRSLTSLAGNNTITIDSKEYQTDEWMNTPYSILSSVSRRLHLQADHPISITRNLIESRFPSFQTYNNLFPIVTTQQNFDSLGFPPDHIGRSKTDTYYLNRDTVLRTHTSAHQADTFRTSASDGYLISADVYRRDAIDRSHYPIFHQMEGARTWDRRTAVQQGKPLAEVIWDDVLRIPKHNIDVEDTNPAFQAQRNPLQMTHTGEEVEAVVAHLKRSLEDVVVTIFGAAKSASSSTIKAGSEDDEPLRVRWVEAYFPFTSPSWELEVFWQGDWLEILGSGIVQHSILANAGCPDRLGWAFGLGLERIAMILYSIPDIRLFWSTDKRFLTQFSKDSPIRRFAPFSKYPACFKDVSFWLPEETRHNSHAAATAIDTGPGAGAAGGEIRETGPTALHADTEPASSPAATPNPVADTAVITPSPPFHSNDVMEIVREVGGSLVESVELSDSFTHPKTQRKSLCFRINYRSLERTLKNEEVNELHERLGAELVKRLRVELR